MVLESTRLMSAMIHLGGLTNATRQPPIGRYQLVGMVSMKFAKGIKRLFLVWIRDRFLARGGINNLYRALGGHIYFEMLYAAVELDLFSIIATHPGSDVADIARRLALPQNSARILLDGLVAIDLLKRRGETYRNTYVGSLVFLKDSELYIGNIVRWQHHIVYKPMFHLLDSLKQGRHVGLVEFSGPGDTLYERISAHPEHEKIFQDAMEEISYQANVIMGEYIDFSETQFLVDIGGGKGVNIVAFASKNPQLRAAVFDIPSVCQMAKQHFLTTSISNRLSAIPGNCFKDSFPTGADCFTFCHFMCIWSPEENIGLLRKAYEALPNGGKVVIFDIMQNDDRRGPLAAAMGSPYFLGLATGRGMIYSIREYESYCVEAGFSKVSRLALPAQHTAVIAEKS